MNPKQPKWWKTIRLYFRLITTYIAANRPHFILGVIVSLLLIIFPGQLAKYVPVSRPRTIGLAGNYTISSLPNQVQNRVSMGLTTIGPDGMATGAAALSWQATDSGKRVTFTLRPDLKWHDGQNFNADQVNYNLKSVELSRPAPNQVSFTFQEPFAPLPAILTQPLFKNGLVGLGDYIIEGIKFNGRFVAQVNLRQRQTGQKLIYKFFPTEENLITALKLGSVDQIENLHQIGALQTEQNYNINHVVDKNIIVTVFFNTRKSPLDEKQVRQALTYALPDQFTSEERALAPVPKDSWFESASIKKYPQNVSGAKSILDKMASGSARPKLTIQTNKSLQPIANQIAALWNQIGAITNVQVADILPEDYGVYLGYLELPIDPDQYALWHSTQQGNISHYKSPKIDKLLEEGRRTLNIAERLNIYSDFQKAITEEVPATFLFYPKIYTVSRR